MLRSFPRLCLALPLFLVLFGACGKDPFVPERRAKSKITGELSSSTKPIYIVFAVPVEPNAEMQVWALRAQQVANEQRVIFRVMGPKDNTNETLADVVRLAVADRVSALIVYPDATPNLGQSLAEAEAQGIPVVLIERTVEAPSGAQPFTVVGHPPFERSATQIVEATLSDLKKASHPLDGPAFVLSDKLKDDTTTQRVEALKLAASKAGFRDVSLLTHDTAVPDSARLAVLDAVAKHPDLSVVLADDSEGLVGAALGRIESEGKPIFFVGGYTGFRNSGVLRHPLRESCYVDGIFEELGDRAIRVAIAKLRGEDFRQLKTLEPQFVKTVGGVWEEGETLIPASRGRDREVETKSNPKNASDVKPQ
jgi:ABC-type sugar transport system substrate-binding protein